MAKARQPPAHRTETNAATGPKDKTGSRRPKGPTPPSPGAALAQALTRLSGALQTGWAAARRLEAHSLASALREPWTEGDVPSERRFQDLVSANTPTDQSPGDSPPSPRASR
jgi:hypothetical protein